VDGFEFVIWISGLIFLLFVHDLNVSNLHRRAVCREYGRSTPEGRRE
jgi:hypothetical protein